MACRFLRTATIVVALLLLFQHLAAASFSTGCAAGFVHQSCSRGSISHQRRSAAIPAFALKHDWWSLIKKSSVLCINVVVENAELDYDCSKDAAEDAAIVTVTAFEECWAATTKTVNPKKDPKIDTILQGLVSPAPQSFYVVRRAFWQLQKEDEKSDENTVAERVATMCNYLLKRGCRLVVRKDAGPAFLPGIDWSIHQSGTSMRDVAVADGWRVVKPSASNGSKQLQQRTHPMALDILATVSDASDQQIAVNEEEIGTMVQQLEQRLNIALGTDLRGRTCADTLFTLALAGVVAPTLYDRLYTVMRLEVERVHCRPSRKSKDLLHIVEKMAASGAAVATSTAVATIYQIVADSLIQRGEYLDTATALTCATYDLHQPRPLLWLWRFSARLSKPTSSSSSWTDDLLIAEEIASCGYQPSTKAWKPTFDDNSKPLVIDLGCGFGVSLLGLASIQKGDANDVSASSLLHLPEGIHWSDCNYLGVDLNQLGTRFATGIAQRQEITAGGVSAQRLQYVWMPTEELLDQILASSIYHGPVALILLQFPTPYRLLLSDSDSAAATPTPPPLGNMQLPDGEESEGFMASPTVLRKIAEILKTKGNIGRLLVQSNCEDVAVHIRNVAVDVGLFCVPSAHPVAKSTNAGASASNDQAIVTERTKRWIEQCGGDHDCRAIGDEWSSVPLLPPKCATETDVSCQLQGTPVHRCLFQATYERKRMLQLDNRTP